MSVQTFISLTPVPGKPTKRKRKRRTTKRKKQKTSTSRRKRKNKNGKNTKKGNKDKRARTAPPSPSESEEVIAHPAVKIFLTYKFQPPNGGPPRDTGFLVPGPAWDSVADEVVWVIHRDPTNHAYLLLENVDFPRRSRDHIRACTQRELGHFESPDTEGPFRVLNKKNVDPYDPNTEDYYLFTKFNKKASRLRRQNNSEKSVRAQRRANAYFKEMVSISDSGFQNLSLTKDLSILEPDPSKVYNFTDSSETNAASATTAPPRVASSGPPATTGI